MKATILFLSILLSSNIATASEQSKLISVPVVFLEALAPRDTTSSERFQKEYEGAITTAKALAKSELTKCGYSISEQTVFYDASDSLQALERAKKAESEGAWLLVGPRRSNHFLLLAKGAPNTASVSTMASSREVAELAPSHLTMAPSNDEMARIAAIDTKDRIKGKEATYLSAISEDCLMCVDFAESFDRHAKQIGIKKLGEVKFVGESPDFAALKAAVSKHQPTVVLLPNYSKVSAQAMANLATNHPDLLYVGGDGWGDSSFGFVQNSPNVERVRGLTVRGFPPADRGLEMFPLGKSLLKSSDASLQKPGSGSALAILRIIEGVKDTLCTARPKTNSDFRSAFMKMGRKNFMPPWGVSIYTLAGGQIRYDKTRR